MTLLETLLVRRSIPSRQLGAPGPDDEQLLRMLEVAVHVPDHGRLSPWRFVRIHGDARVALGRELEARLIERNPDAPAAKREKERDRFSHAPCVIAVIARLTPGHKVPESEQIQSGSCVCFALLQAAEALGFGAQWLTGIAAYDPKFLDVLGVGANERVLGFVHIGTIVIAHEEHARQRPDPRTLLTDWQPS
jgi:nitroreductase